MLEGSWKFVLRTSGDGNQIKYAYELQNEELVREYKFYGAPMEQKADAKGVEGRATVPMQMAFNTRAECTGSFVVDPDWKLNIQLMEGKVGPFSLPVVPQPAPVQMLTVS
jgi:hypothetical protein